MLCSACEAGEHYNCNMATWCECDCDGSYGWPWDDDEPQDYEIDKASPLTRQYSRPVNAEACPKIYKPFHGYASFRGWGGKSGG